MYQGKEGIRALLGLPLFQLVFKAHGVHREHFDARSMELCTLMSIKTGCCPEDCAYCPQSGHYNTGLKKENLLDVDVVLKQARKAKEQGAKRFCMGAAWRNPPKKEFVKVLAIVKQVKALGLETCMTLGSLDDVQAKDLKDAGLDYYNHNLDTSPDYYKKIITTRAYEERLQTLAHVSQAGLRVCCGGIIGMGESSEDRIEFLWQLKQLPSPPESIPINRLIPIAGTPLENTDKIDDFDFIKMIACTRIVFPSSMVRLSAGRETMSDTMQAWCFMAGANSIFYGETLLTAANPKNEQDLVLLRKLGLRVEAEVAAVV
jgi:biotin synthase